MSLSPPSQCDVVILGGGPAGMATAQSLLQHDPALTVVVVERSGYDQMRIGETLPPNARSLLQQLDVWSAFIQDDHLLAYGTSAAWGSSTLHANEFSSACMDMGGTWIVALSIPCWPRQRSSVVRGCTCGTKVLDCQQQPDQRWQLTVCVGGRTLAVNRPICGGCDGASGLVLRVQQGANRISHD